MGEVGNDVRLVTSAATKTDCREVRVGLLSAELRE
jgi:hypothetical protein